jgi:hypothetical protein
MSHKVLVVDGVFAVASFKSVAHAEDRTKSEIAANCAHAANDATHWRAQHFLECNGAAARHPDHDAASVTRATRLVVWCAQPRLQG